MLKTPVALLLFNRPETTRRVFEAVRRARPARLLVVADGPRKDRPGEGDLCAAVRAVVDGIDWPCEVLKEYSECNLGCRNRVSSGLDWVFKVAEEAIILEDDCLPHPDFFRFCEALLERYREDDRVVMIGGTNYLRDKLDIRESFCFSRYFAIWGWATWRRAWAHFDLAMRDWPELKRQGQLNGFYRQSFVRKHLAAMFDLAYLGKLDTWDVQWFYSCLFNNGLSVVPRRNLISNIGLDGTHTSRDISNHNFPVFGMEPGELVFPGMVFPNRSYDEEFFRRKIRRTLRMKIENRMHLLLSAMKIHAGV
jgi:hypothetical protein